MKNNEGILPLGIMRGVSLLSDLADLSMCFVGDSTLIYGAKNIRKRKEAKLSS